MVSVLAIFFLAFLVVGFINKGDLTKKSAMEMTPEEITSLKADLENLTALNNDLQTSNVNLLSKLADLEKTTARKEQIYVVSKGETLSAIATKIFGTGNKFREIAIDNNLPNPDQLTPGQKLIIKF
jgi:nucleoid-associated protein YgaU